MTLAERADAAPLRAEPHVKVRPPCQLGWRGYLLRWQTLSLVNYMNTSACRGEHLCTQPESGVMPACDTGASRPAWKPCQADQGEFVVLLTRVYYAVFALVLLMKAMVFGERAGQDAAPHTMHCWGYFNVRLPCNSRRPSRHCCNFEEPV